ncbi:MAG: 4Fe-4S ferredoxin [Spirochaetales bacterium]|nr:4Fe-4S ferredoxin [Spirochaetales bacterium]
MYASRNISLCTKDCLCLFVCPSGATDTESGQIDKDLCLDGCRRCVDACPSHAISLVFENYPAHKLKDEVLSSSMLALLEEKCREEAMAEYIAGNSDSPAIQKLARALRQSCRILGEDCARESDYFIPQSEEVGRMLKALGIEVEGL